MADRKFAWLESGQDEEWPLIGLVDQVNIISILQFAQFVNPERRTENESLRNRQRLHPCASFELEMSIVGVEMMMMVIMFVLV